MEQTTQHFETRQNMFRNDFEIFHYREPKPGCVELHHHDFYEIYYFLGGHVEYRVEGRTYSLQKGDLLLINPMELHQPMVLADSETYERIVLWINREYLTSLGQDGTRLIQCFEPGHKNLLRPSAIQAGEIRNKMEMLIQQRRTDDFGSELYAKGIFLQLMVVLNRLSISSYCEKEDSTPLVTQIVNYINNHYGEPLTLDHLAQVFYISKYHLSHKFTQATGVSVYRYVMLKRLQATRQRLMDGYTPKEAFLSSGFGDYANFYRAFLSEYGVTPQVFASTIEKRISTIRK